MSTKENDIWTENLKEREAEEAMYDWIDKDTEDY